MNRNRYLSIKINCIEMQLYPVPVDYIIFLSCYTWIQRCVHLIIGLL